MSRSYYEAYDDRYQQVHQENLRWASDQPTPIVARTLEKFESSTAAEILELGCGEGRDAAYLLGRGYSVLATDISPTAVDYCRKIDPAHADCYQILDCVAGELEGEFSFIYAVAVLHMLVEDPHRTGFYRFIRQHLKETGIALICTMGDGEVQMQSDVSAAFAIQPRTHQETGRTMQLAGTSCRMVSFESFRRELARNGFEILEEGLTSSLPDFDLLMYAVVKRI